MSNRRHVLTHSEPGATICKHALPFLLVLFIASPVHAFSFELDKRAYMPGEPMQIRCIWPAEAPPQAQRITFAPYIGADGTAAGERTIPQETISYAANEGNPGCVSLRAPFVPGTYVLEAMVDSEPEVHVTEAIVVGELPAGEFLSSITYERVTDAPFSPDNGDWFTYDVTLAEDRCYPQYLWWKAHEEVWIALVEQDSHAVAWTHNGRFSASSCVDCAEEIDQYACYLPGRYSGRIRAPARAGNWELVFAQGNDPNLACTSDCDEAYIDLTALPDSIRVLDRSPTLDVPAVADIYFSTDAEGADRIPEDEVADSNFYVWVQFDSANPYGRETLVLSSASSSSAKADISLIRISESLFRSERRVAPFNLLSEASR